jgi:hypothetical protein
VATSSPEHDFSITRRHGRSKKVFPPGLSTADRKKESTASMKVFENFTSKFPEKMVRDEDINRNRKVSPGATALAAARNKTTHVLDPLRNATSRQNQNFQNEEKTQTESKNSTNAG